MYEIEIKVLLGTRENVDLLLSRVRAAHPELAAVANESQLNHYFDGGSLADLGRAFADRLSDDERASFADIAAKAVKFSVRTRHTDDRSILVVKASIDETGSVHGTARREWEVAFPRGDAEAFDALVLSAGFRVLSQWSRSRDEYAYSGGHLCIDRNAGYGYLAEFERVLDRPEDAPTAKEELRAFIESVGFAELPQDRLDRMFAHYNEHWREYYGTDRTFVLE